jgi:predicted polyphosphate/ATP-dependent NAD kinase
MVGSIGLVTYPFEMGEDEAKRCGFKPMVIGSIEKGKTTYHDTRNAAKEMLELGVDLLLFAGGDGTAKDICEAIDVRLPALGIPSGVKIHSAAFGINPEKTGDLAARYLQEDLPLKEAEVMDTDEEAFRRGRVAARLYGYLRIPYEKLMTQNVKIGAGDMEHEEYQKKAIAAYVVEEMNDDQLYVLCPGSTIKAIGDELGIHKTLLGVDVVSKRRIVAEDVNEAQLLKLIEQKKAKIVVTPIGGQGYIFGRGNQQISPRVIREVGRDNIIIAATKTKLNTIVGRPLLVDTGDIEVDGMLAGYMKVTVGYREETMKEIER